MILIIMGVSGSGKTSVSQALADQTDWEVAEADNYHTSLNKEKMSKGTPLTDEVIYLKGIPATQSKNVWRKEGHNGIVTCSALKRIYRETLIWGDKELDVCQQQNNKDIAFIHLHGPLSLLESRMNNRNGHFMPSKLLQSQFDTLEMLSPEENGFVLSIEHSADEIVSQILKYIKKEIT